MERGGGEMSDQQELLKLLEIASQRVQHCHDALWEEAKHYSWWVYIIFAGLIYLYFKLPEFTLLEQWQQALLMYLGSAFGVFISIMGFNAVRLESKYFKDARCVRHCILAKLEGVDQSIKEKFDPVKDKKGEDKGGFGIRCGFELTFIITALLFAGFGVFSVLTLLNGS
jgi:hypothetical protein